MSEDDIIKTVLVESIKEIHEKEKQELISEFVKSYENLREFVLEAPILSEDVYKLRDYFHKIKNYIRLDIKKWEERKK